MFLHISYQNSPHTANSQLQVSHTILTGTSEKSLTVPEPHKGGLERGGRGGKKRGKKSGKTRQKERKKKSKRQYDKCKAEGERPKTLALLELGGTSQSHLLP